jgi:sugar lactone lactonase YvrE
VTQVAERQASPFIDGLHFGESPRWHEGRLWYADFYDETVQSVGEAGDVRIEATVEGEPAGIGWLPDGRLLVVTRKPRTVLRLEPDRRLLWERHDR